MTPGALHAGHMTLSTSAESEMQQKELLPLGLPQTLAQLVVAQALCAAAAEAEFDLFEA